MKGKHLAIGLLVALFAFVGLVFWLGLSGGDRPEGTGRRGANEPTSASPASAGHTSVEPGSTTAHDGGAITQTIADRRVRDELRRRILAGWAQGEGETAAAARSGKIPPMPMSPDGGVDPDYIRSVIRNEMFPMVTKCYEDLLSRKPDAGGRIEMAFKIVGDDELGGIIDEAEIDGGAAGAFADEKMETCMRESLLSLSFRPPPNDGWVTIVYPIELAPGD